MDVNLVNRIGIFMAFVAGFLLAPELIGEKRLLAAGRKLDQWAIGARGSVLDRIGMGGWERERSVQFSGNLLIFLLIPVFYFLVYHWLVAKKPDWAFLGTSILAHLLFSGGITLWIFFIFISMRRWKPLFFLFAAPLIIIPFMVFHLSMQFLAWLMKTFSRTIQGGVRFRSVLVVTGLVLYVAGHFLQILATY